MPAKPTPETAAESESPRPFPELVLVMRHARMQQAPDPVDLLRPPTLRKDDTVSATADLTDAGRTLAETLHEMARAGDHYRRLYFVVEGTSAASLTGETMQEAYTNARQGEKWDDAPAAGPIERLDIDLASPYATSIELWLNAVREKLGSVKATLPTDQRVAVVVVGHDPRMGWLLRSLIGASRKTLVPALSHTELIACYRATGSDTYLADWALSPTDTKLEEALRAKVQSKMDTAKVFGAVLAAVIAFVADNVAELDGYRRHIGLVALASLGLATTLYLVTMFWYDRLLMPTRFWATGHAARPLPPSRRWVVLRRPPSSSVWVLYQNMQLIWKRCFLSATIAAGTGVALYVAAVSRPDGRADWLVLVAGVAVFSIAAIAVGRWGRPILGVQD